NTIVINGRSQSEGWGQFRVGRRAVTKILQDGRGGVFEAQHDGYRRLGILHKRTSRTKPNGMELEDCLSKTAEAISHYHHDPTIQITRSDVDSLYLENEFYISFVGQNLIWLESFNFSLGFNRTVTSTRICVSFNQNLKTNITFI